MIYALPAFFAGIILALIIVFFISPSLMLKENRSRFTFDESIEKLEKAIFDQDYKIPAKHDMRETMMKFGKAQILNNVVYEICNPDLAEAILLSSTERIVSSLMPCRIALYEKADGKTYFSRMNSGLLAKPMGKITRKQMKIAAADVERILESIG